MKTLHEIESILRDQKPILRQKFRVKEIGIFGSFVRGEQKAFRRRGQRVGVLLEQHVLDVYHEAGVEAGKVDAIATLGSASVICSDKTGTLTRNEMMIERIHTASGSAQFGVVGVENSVEGVVTRSLDLFLHTPTHVVGEVSLLVRHNLLRQNNSLDEIEAVLAHPQALAQCQAWLSKHLPHAERKPVSSNAEGARLAATNPAWAALASERAATQFGLHIVAHAIQDEAYNRTRFAVICLPHTLATSAPSGHDCTSRIISVPNRPGAVPDLLVPLKKYGVSMTRFESRPARTGQWEYYFYIDIEGHPAEPNVAQALGELQQLCAFYKLLGTYPIAA